MWGEQKQARFCYFWHFEGIIINRVCMNRPSLLELQYLQGRVSQGVSLCSNDVDALDRSCQASHCSEMANCINDIFFQLARVPLPSYWESFSAIVAYSHAPDILRFAYCTLSSRISREWAAIDEPIRLALKQYVIERIDRAVGGQEDAQFLNCFNRILVNMLRFQLGTLFRDFVRNIEEEGLRASPKRILNNLTILEMVLEDGFDVKEELVSPAEVQLFRGSLEHDMRSILKFFCLCLQKEGSQRVGRVKKCLEALKVSIDYIPAFELFNCNLIELLVGLIDAPEFQSALTACFREIFCFRQGSTSDNCQPKIAQKLLLILEFYLDRMQPGESDALGKENESTQESFQSRKTKRRMAEQDFHEDTLHLLFQFLNRYVPFMARGSEDVVIQAQEDSNTRPSLTQGLYETLTLMYWRILGFLSNILDTINPSLGTESEEDGLEEASKIVCCLKQMVLVLEKLNIQPQEEIYLTLHTAVLNFAFPPKDFHQFYRQWQLVPNQPEDTDDLYREAFQEEYKELLKAIMRCTKINRHFLATVERHIKRTIEDALDLRGETEKEVKHVIVRVNQMSWSAVEAYCCNKQLFARFKFNKYIQEMAKIASQPHMHTEIAKCFSINSKFMSQIYSQSCLTQSLLPTLRLNKNQLYAQFTLLLLSKVLLYEELQPDFVLQDAQIMLARLKEIERLFPDKETLLGFYPAFFHMVGCMIETSSQQKTSFPARELLMSLIFNELSELETFSKVAETKDCPDLQKTIMYFKKMVRVSRYLQQASKKVQGCQSLYTFMKSVLLNAILKFQFKYKCFFEFLAVSQKENFDIVHILAFRQHYLSILREHTSLCLLQLKLKVKETTKCDKVSKMVTAQLLSRTDFVGQKQFKPKEFFGFALELYRLMIASDFQGHKQIINQSISQLMASLEGWEGQGDIITEKYKFWKQIVVFYLWGLSRRNKEYLVQLLDDFESIRNQISDLDLILEVFMKIVEVLREDCQKKSRPILEEFIDIFMATFQKLFSSNSKKESIFMKVGKLLFSQIQLVWCLRTSLKENCRKDNMEILSLLLQNHITKRTGVAFDHQHTSKFARLFSERQLGPWCQHLKDYVVYLTQRVGQHLH